MTGQQLFEAKSQRDYTGSEADEYAQLLMSIFMHIGAALFPLLEIAENEGRKVGLKDVEKDEIMLTDLVLV